ncbi:beta strand repeat-containing protein, partial [Ochrobactrum quorumnocens]
NVLTGAATGFINAYDSTVNVNGATVTGTAQAIELIGSNGTITDSTISAGPTSNAFIIRRSSAGATTTATISGSTINAGVMGFDISGGATINIIDSDIQSGGTGVRALDGSTANLTRTTIETSGRSGHGIHIASGSDANVVGSSVTTNGTNAIGVQVAGAGSRADIFDSSVTTNGLTAVAIANAGGEVHVVGSTIETFGRSSDGVNASGGTTEVRNTTITTHNDEAYGARVGNDAKVAIVGSEIITSGASTYGVNAAGIGSTVTLDNTNVTTTGLGAHTLFAYDNAVVSVTGGNLVTSGDGAVGVRVKGASATVNSTNISTSGVKSHGVLANGAATVNIGRDPITGAPTLIHTTGDQSVGINAEEGSTVNVDGAIIRTEGGGTGVSWAIGVLAEDGSVVNLNDTTIETAGEYAAGINAVTAGSKVNMTGGSITTTGANGDGAVAYIGATVNLTNVNISTQNARGIAAGDLGSSVMMTGGSVTTKGDGILNSAAYATRGASIDVNSVDIRTEGDDARGLHAFGPGSIVNAKGSRVTTIGTGSHGGFASAGGTVNVADGVIITEGAGSHGLVAQNGSSVFATGSGIQTSGAESAGVYLANDSTAVLDNTLVLTKDGPALKTAGGDVSFDLKNGSQAIGGNGMLLQAVAGTTTTLTADGEVVLSGDMIAEADDTVIDASLSNRTYWQGAAKGVTTVAVDTTSHWLMTGSSDVGVLSNDGVVEFDAAAPYKTLTAGTLDVNGGSFILNTKLNEGGAASETDKIVVTGDTNGNGFINVRNNGGTGAFTGTGATDGIQIV